MLLDSGLMIPKNNCSVNVYCNCDKSTILLVFQNTTKYCTSNQLYTKLITKTTVKTKNKQRILILITMYYIKDEKNITDTRLTD